VTQRAMGADWNATWQEAVRTPSSDEWLREFKP
jgi:hypothetical protein